MPTFIDMSALTLKSSASGQEEIQVSESNKINTSQIAALTFAQNPNMGDLPINSRLKYVDNKTTLLGMLKMLTAAANVGRLRIVSGNPATGAFGKPELAFIVNIVQGTNAETAGTNGLQIFHLTNDFLRVIPSSSIGMAWPTLQTLTDEDVIEKLNSTASGDWGGLGMKLPWTGGSVKPIKVDDFAVINEIWPAELTPGTTVPFYADGGVLSAPSGAADTAYVGQVILDGDFDMSGTATVVAYGNRAGRIYYARLDFNGQSIDWFSSPVGTLTLTTFKNLTINASVSDMNIGEMLGFYSPNGGSTSGPGASPLFGYIQKTSYPLVNIFAYTADGKKSWLGYSAGSVVGWTPVGGASGGGGEQTVIWINANQNVFDVGLYPFTKLGEMFPIFIDASATNNPSKEGYPCAGTVQCVGYQGPESWEAVFVVGSADEDQTPRRDYYKAHLSYGMGGSAWIELTTGSYGGTERLFVGDIALAPAAPETFNLGGEVHDGDLLMIVYDFISSDHTMVGPKAGRSIIWTATSGTYDVTVEAFDYSSATGGVSRISGFNLMLSASGTILSMEATGEVDTIIEAFHVVGIYRLSKAL